LTEIYYVPQVGEDESILERIKGMLEDDGCADFGIRKGGKKCRKCDQDLRRACNQTYAHKLLRKRGSV